MAVRIMRNSIKRSKVVMYVTFFATVLIWYIFTSPSSLKYEGELENEELTNCTNEFIVDTNVQRNENTNILEECKGMNESFRPLLIENMKIVKEYTFNVSNVLLRQLKLDRNGIDDLSTQTGQKSSIPTFVTGLSDNHYGEFLCFLEMVNKLKNDKYPKLHLVVYNIGLSIKNLITINETCNCTVRNFPFEMYPQHVRHLRGFAWKPIIIQTVLQESDFVMWMDTSIRLKNTDPYFQKAKRYGIQVLTGYGSISLRTHRHLFGALRENPCLFNYPELQAGLVLITRSCLTLTYIMRPWVSCALQYGCMDIPNAENYYDCSNERNISSCHRSDQSVLGIILTRLFNNRRHQFVLGNDFAEVCRGCL